MTPKIPRLHENTHLQDISSPVDIVKFAMRTSLLSKGACCLKEHSTDFTNKIEFTCHKEYYNSGKSSTKCEEKILMLSLGLTGSLCNTDFETYGVLPVGRGLTKGTIEKKEKKGVRISLLPLL